MIKCIAIDDEPLALSQLATYISKVPFLQLVAACPDTSRAMQAIEDTHIDAMFADINMPDLNGLDFIRSLIEPPIIVLTTAYSDYAIQGYKVNAIDYLLKPFSFDEFLAAANKVRQRYTLARQAAHAQVAELQPQARQPLSQAVLPQPPFLYIKSGHGVIRLRTGSILYIEGMAEYVRIHTADSPKPITAHLTLSKIERQLPQDTFLRVHKSYIANMAQATRATRTSITFTSATAVPVSQSQNTRTPNLVIPAAADTIPVGEAYRDILLSYIRSHSLI